MLLHARCRQRIVSTYAHRTVWRRRCIRHYALDLPSDPEWFQKLRSELLDRRPQEYEGDLDPLHREQLYSTLVGFSPEYANADADSNPYVSLAELLTSFNAQLPSSQLLNDGTDPLHYPGEPWVRRMWAGGAVKLNPELYAGSELPFRWKHRVACLEQIKDVRLHELDDDAKIFVKIERRFASRASVHSQALKNQSRGFKSLIDDDDWSDSFVKEQRNLVFMKPKTAAELERVQSGQALADTRYLRAPESPDYSFLLTPTRSLLFRYSAVTFNAHLLHLDPTYARSVEGHRNVLVHGPLTLTLMLQVLNKHLEQFRMDLTYEYLASMEYRNIAPLYCDEEMRICVKRKKRVETGYLWDVWIEGPTGGMAVKAVMHSTLRRTNTVFRLKIEPGAVEPSEVEPAEVEPEEGTPNADLPNVRVPQAERRKAWGEEQRSKEAHPRPDQPQPPIPPRSYVTFSQVWRRQRVGNALPYLYDEVRSPLISNARVDDTRPAPSLKRASKPEIVRFTRDWRTKVVGKALPYLYLPYKSPLIARMTLGDRFPPAGTATESNDVDPTGVSYPKREMGRSRGRIRVRKIEGVRIWRMDSSRDKAETQRAYAKRVGWGNTVDSQGVGSWE